MTTASGFIKEETIDNFSGDKPVSQFTLTGAGGLSVTILTYGGIVQRILVPDPSGAPVDVVLGFENTRRYTAPHPYFGATAGRIAGRVTNGQLKIGKERFQLPLNDPPHHLHGGPASLDSQIWQATTLSRKDGAPSLKLSLSSIDGENGYPGCVNLSVIYTVTHDNRFIYETRAASDRPTPVSLTHHSYFNLAGEGSGTTDDHEIKIQSDSAFEADHAMGLTGKCPEVAGRPNDVRSGRIMRDLREGIRQKHGDLYWLGEGHQVRPAAWLRDPRSGRTLEVSTDCSCLQFYSGIGLDGTLIGKSGSTYGPGTGVCLECEGYPNAFGAEDRYGSIIVQPGTTQKSRTEYRFYHQTESLIST